MIARIPAIVSRSLFAGLTVFALAGAVKAAPFLLDPATTYGQITVDVNGDIADGDAILNVPTAVLGALNPSVNADGEIDQSIIKIASVEGAEGLEFSLESVKLIRGENDQLQIELGVTDQGAAAGMRAVRIILENTQTGTTMPVGVMVDVQ